jgi:hypothetical protein
MPSENSYSNFIPLFRSPEFVGLRRRIERGSEKPAKEERTQGLRVIALVAAPMSDVRNLEKCGSRL